MARYRFGEVWNHPSRVGDWWLELPLRRRAWWRELLLEPGAGWLRWGFDWREYMTYDPPDFEQWQVAPPLRRAWITVTAFFCHPAFVLRGDVRWTERPTLADVSVLKDDDRSRLWR